MFVLENCPGTARKTLHIEHVDSGQMKDGIED